MMVDETHSIGMTTVFRYGHCSFNSTYNSHNFELTRILDLKFTYMFVCRNLLVEIFDFKHHSAQ